MYFSKISLRKETCSLRQLSSYIHKDGYYYHQLMWDLFSENNPDKKRDFLYHADTAGRWPAFYVVSAAEPNDEKNLWQIETRNYSPKINKDERFYFRLRANPRIRRLNQENRPIDVDIVQDTWIRNKDKISARETSKNELMQIAGEDWVAKKAAKHGFQTGNVIVENFQKERFKKKNHLVSFSTLDFRGQLIVTDPDLFLNTLFQGIGSAKGFGCGLLMVKRCSHESNL